MKFPLFALLVSLVLISCDDTETPHSAVQSQTTNSAYLHPVLHLSDGDVLPATDSIHIHFSTMSPDSVRFDSTLSVTRFDSLRLALPQGNAFHLTLDGIKIRNNGSTSRIWTGTLDGSSRNSAVPLIASIRVLLLPQDTSGPKIFALTRDTSLGFDDSTFQIDWIVVDDSLARVDVNGQVSANVDGRYVHRGTIASGETILAVLCASDKAGNSSSDTVRISRQTAPILPTTLTPTFSLNDGNFPDFKTLEIHGKTPGSTIHYALDGSDPSCQDRLYSGALNIDSSVQVKAIGCAPGYLPSQINSLQIGFAATAAIFSTRSGLYTSSQDLSLSTSTPGGSIHYANDGMDPTCTSLRYVTPLKVDSSQKIKAIVCRDGWAPSAIDSGHFTLALPALSFSPDSGIYDGAVLVSVTNTVPGSSILYTTDSTIPTNPPSGTTQVYTGPIGLGRSAMIRAMAVRQGWISSPLSSRSYIPLGDTIPLADFESGKAVTLWGKPFQPFGCATGTNATGTPGCSITKGHFQLPTPTRIGDPAFLGTHVARMDFDLHASSMAGLADPFNGPGYAGIYALVPGSFMSKAIRMNFWARFEPAPGNTATSVPMMFEYAHSNLDNTNAGYLDAFQRVIVPLDTVWRQYSYTLSAFWYPVEAILKIADSTNFSPKTPSWVQVDSYGNGRSSSMNALGLSKWWGSISHSNSDITWRHNVNRDAAFAKSSINKFRWSVLQPSSEPLAQEMNPVAGLSSSFRGALLLDRIQIERAPF
ncbi:MAG: hypothetical protein RL318_38 [Fibrobacterota bacterium]